MERERRKVHGGNLRRGPAEGQLVAEAAFRHVSEVSDTAQVIFGRLIGEN